MNIMGNITSKFTLYTTPNVKIIFTDNHITQIELVTMPYKNIWWSLFPTNKVVGAHFYLPSDTVEMPILISP